VIARLFLPLLLAFTAFAIGTALTRVEPQFETAAVVLRLVLAGLMTYLWVEWFRADRRAS
jgi:hypothetical protein